LVLCDRAPACRTRGAGRETEKVLNGLIRALRDVL